MRGFHLLIIWIMALAVTVAYAGPKDPTPVHIPDEVLDVPEDEVEDSPPEVEEEEPEEEEYEPEPEAVRPEPQRRVSLELNAHFGRGLGCMVPNCASFIPMQRMCGGIMVSVNSCVPPPQYRNVVYQDIYVPAQQPGFPMQQGFCPCQGQMGCGCGAQTNVLLVNSIPPMPNITPRWGGLTVHQRPVWGPTPQAVFQVPNAHQPNLNDRNTGFIPRLGYGADAGSF